MLKVGLLGAGRIGRIHAAAVAGNFRAQLVAVADPVAASAAAVATQAGAVVREIADILSSDDVDAVVIATPTDTHADLIEKAAMAGKAIFCEKPVDLDAGRIRLCLEVVQQASVPLMIGFNRRFDRHFAELKRRLDEGIVGMPEIVTIISRDPAPPPVSYIEHSGGLFRDMMIHDLDMTRFLLDEEPVLIHAVGFGLVDPAIAAVGDIDTAAVTLTTASGRIAQISNSRRATYGYDQRIEVHGSKGLLRAGNVHQSTVEVANDSGFTTDPVLPFFLERYMEAYRAELDAFILAVEKGVPPKPSGEDGLKAQLLADAATESWKSGKPVALKE